MMHVIPGISSARSIRCLKVEQKSKAVKMGVKCAGKSYPRGEGGSPFVCDVTQQVLATTSSYYSEHYHKADHVLPASATPDAFGLRNPVAEEVVLENRKRPGKERIQ